MRFIEDQIEDKPTINLRKKTKAECYDILSAAKYEMVEGGYDYILRLPVSSFTAEQITKHARELLNIRTQIEAMEKTTSAALWTADLQTV
jgi:hypothetical protein